MKERRADIRADGKKRPPQPQKQAREVSDPHPGSVSDGTHPEASEVKRPDGEAGKAGRRPA
jgi:hypothetical protein